MTLPEEGCLLRVFIGESDLWHGRPLYEALVSRRATASRGRDRLSRFARLRANSRIHTAKILRLSQDLPILIEIVRRRRKNQGVSPRDRGDGSRRPRHIGTGKSD